MAMGDTFDSVKSSLDEVMQSQTWNFVLIIAAIVTTAVAIRNAYVASEKIAELQNK